MSAEKVRTQHVFSGTLSTDDRASAEIRKKVCREFQQEKTSDEFGHLLALLGEMHEKVRAENSKLREAAEVAEFGAVSTERMREPTLQLEMEITDDKPALSPSRSVVQQNEKLLAATATSEETRSLALTLAEDEHARERILLSKMDKDARQKFAKILHGARDTDHSASDELDALLADATRRGVMPKHFGHAPFLSSADAALALNNARERQKHGPEVTEETFVDMICLQDLHLLVGEEVVQKIFELRVMFSNDDLSRLISKHTYTDAGGGHHRVSQSSHRQDSGLSPIIQNWISPSVTVAIICNAAVTIVSADVDPGAAYWDIAETVFTCFFALELSLKLWAGGLRRFFFSNERNWNIIDSIIVGVAAVDALVSLISRTQNSSSTIATARIIRLTRVFRVVRVLRYKIFKELVLMIQGLFSGLKTLSWGIFLLFVVIAVLGFLLRQTLGRWCTGQETLHELCDEALLNAEGPELFSNFIRSCFTVYRCFTEACETASGDHILPLVYNTKFGLLLIPTYMLTYLIVVFGLFNLIMAVFVESTMEAAKSDERRRRQLRRREQDRTAHKLQRMVAMFCDNSVTSRWSSPDGTPLRCLNLQVEITRAEFLKTFADPAMDDLLDSLDISMDDPGPFFDALDSDGSGTLDTSELVEGIMKLFGDANTKSDLVAIQLSVRALQRDMQVMKARVPQDIGPCQEMLRDVQRHIQQFQAGIGPSSARSK